MYISFARYVAVVPVFREQLYKETLPSPLLDATLSSRICTVVAQTPMISASGSTTYAGEVLNTAVENSTVSNSAVVNACSDVQISFAAHLVSISCSLAQLCSTGCLSFLFRSIVLIRFSFAGDPFAHSKVSKEDKRSEQEPVSKKNAVVPRRQDKFLDKKRAPVLFLTMLAVHSWCSFAHAFSPGEIYKNLQKMIEPLWSKSTGGPQWQRNVTSNGKSISCDRPLVWPPSSVLKGVPDPSFCL